ncbi:MAG: ABC transporter ATP-binding protein [Clostridiaceae bacterium]|nr:ABC transporter ATP-binding protein [Clostridiaceae bacterium]
MLKLRLYFKDYIKESILGPLFKLLEATLELFVPIVIAAIIDIGITNNDKTYIINMCLILLGLGIVGLVFSITAQYYAAKAAVGTVTKLKHKLFSHIQSFSFTELDSIGTSTLITRMTSDMNQLQTGINLTLRLLLRSPFVVFGAMIMAFTIDTKSALIFTVAIPILSIVVFGIIVWCIPLYKTVQEKLDKVLGLTRENLTGVRVIRSFCKEADEINDFENKNEELTKMQKHVGSISSLLNPITLVIINIAIIALIYTGAIQVEAGIISQGAVVALYNYMSQILVELIKLANLIITITKSVASGNRIQAVLEINSDSKQINSVTDDISTDNIVEFNNVTLRYKNAGGDSLQNISFKVKHGETIGIIGGTGSGKSSLVNLIPRFYDATAGEVIVNGINVVDYPVENLRDKIGIVPQKAVLFKGTIRENIQWGKNKALDEEIYEALSIAQVKEVVDSKGGLDYEIEQGGRNLSGGQKQRLTIARAVVKKPEILILDDSTSALDFATDAALRKAIRELSYCPTVFIVSQRTSSIQYADNIIVLDDGIMVGMGKHDKLLQSCQVYREIYNSQFKKESE